MKDKKQNVMTNTKKTKCQDEKIKSQDETQQQKMSR